jgi:hypothetical protein
MAFKIVLSFIPIILLSTCDKEKSESIKSAEFKTEILFEIQDGKILIPTYWGKDKMRKLLVFDTHAPTWADSSVLNNNFSVSRIKNLFYKTTTIDGVKLTGDVYRCDSIRLGSISFDNVIIYNISSANHDVNRTRINSAFGDNLISLGIWKIDFENNLITFASSLDSITGLQNTTRLPSEFNDNIISIDASFSKHIHRKLAVDLGYNGSVVIPKQQPGEIDTSFDTAQTTKTVLKTLSGNHYANDIVSVGRINIGSRSYPAILHSSGVIKEGLLGLEFFRQFKFVVLDYRNKSIYVSTETRIEF